MAPRDQAHGIVRSRTARGRETAHQFVDAALKLVAARGLDGLTIGRLAAEVGYAVGALYRHFPGKGALIVAMQARVIEGVREDLRAADVHLAETAVRQGDGPAALARLLVAAGVYRRMAAVHPDRFALLSLSLGDPRELVPANAASPALAPLTDLMAQMTTRFAEAATSGALTEGDPAKRSVVLWSALHGVLQIRKLERFGVPTVTTDPLAGDLVHSLLLGWGASPADLTAAEGLAERAVPKAAPSHVMEKHA